MSESTYVAISRKIALFNKNNVVVNNIANSSTVGYKKDVPVFKDVLAENKSSANGKTHFVYDLGTFVDHSSAPFKQTYNNLDFAIITPKHFFALQTPNGIRYTRDGSFLMDRSNTLVSSEGFPVLSSNGESITLDQNVGEKIIIDKTGVLSANGNQINTIGIFMFENEQVLKKEGNNSFFSTVDAQQLGSNYTILQGFLEDSNINPIAENIELIATVRDAEEISNIYKNIDGYLKDLSSLLKS